MKVGIGPYLAPVEGGKTSLVVGCGEKASCKGTLRLRALVRLLDHRFTTRAMSKFAYSLAPGQIKELALSFPSRRWDRLRGNRRFLIVDAIQGGQRVAKRGFDFNLPQKGGTAKHW